MIKEKDDELVVLIQQLGGKVNYLPNPGNAGDSLIACATYQFFERNNIEYKCCQSEKDISDDDSASDNSESEVDSDAAEAGAGQMRG